MLFRTVLIINIFISAIIMINSIKLLRIFKRLDEETINEVLQCKIDNAIAYQDTIYEDSNGFIHMSLATYEALDALGRIDKERFYLVSDDMKDNEELITLAYGN